MAETPVNAAAGRYTRRVSAHAARLAWPLALTAALGLAQAAAAGSGLRIERPTGFGGISASTYDANHQRVGDASIAVEQLGDGHVRLSSDSGFTGGARTRIVAELAPIASSGLLQPLREESRSVDPAGHPLGVMSIDHERSVARCTRPGDGGDVVQELKLPQDDRVANVPLNLLFLPLVRGETDEVDFQILLCRGHPRLVDFVASLAPESRAERGADRAVEVRYAPDLGLATGLARGFVPRLSFWFQGRAPFAWLGHRVPLYGNGPEVLVIRDGVSLDVLPDD